MTLREYLKKNPPAIVCSVCENPMILLTELGAGQVIYCRFCLTQSLLPPDTTADTISAPFGNMVVSLVKIPRETFLDKLMREE